jgi:monoamine oxidase
LEARDRVGGRVFTAPLPDGTPVDLGGQWLGPTQSRLYALCARFGIDTYPMHVAGQNLLRIGGTTRPFRGHIPARAGLRILAAAGLGLWKLERLARRIPLDAPWQAPQAARLDAMSLGDWMRTHIRQADAAFLMRVGVESVFAAAPDEISLLHALFYMRSGGSFDRLTRSRGGAQQDRVHGGMQSVAEALARTLGDGVHLNSPVERLKQHAAGVEVWTGDRTWSARHAIVALPPRRAAALDYTPDVSATRRSLWRQTPMGSVIKCLAAYPTAFWRDAGLSGSAVCDLDPVNVTFDASPRSGAPGLLLGFIEGPAARVWAERSAEARKAAVLAVFSALFGSRALTPDAWVEKVWSADPHSGGCYAGVLPPGVWTSVGHVIRQSEGRIHWAGTETACVWNGYIEGAIRSGERAADAVRAQM